MLPVLLVIHLMIAAALIGAVLLQRSEGGALGIGGGGGLMSGRGTANLLTRTTAILAVAFFATSILLTILGKQSAPSSSVFDSLPASAPAGATETTPATGTGGTGGSGGILDKLKPQQPANPEP